MPESDSEIIEITCEIFRKLGFRDFVVRISNRKLVEGMVRSLGIKNVNDVFRSIDKLDKIGSSGVREELRKRGVKKSLIPRIMEFIGISGRPQDVLEKAERIVEKEPLGTEGLKNLRDVVRSLGRAEKNIVADLSIVRGLEYYTGCVFEVGVSGEKLSLGGGGRYDNLVRLYGGQETPCVGIGIGFERIFELMERRGMFSLPPAKSQVFVINAGEKFLEKARNIANQLRKTGIKCETDLMGRNLRKQMDYANSRKIPWVLFVGEKEIQKGRFTLRDMKTGKETSLPLREIAKKVGKS
jgi:histidyl-tRNA synthetase